MKTYIWLLTKESRIYITPEDNEKEEMRLRNLGVKFTTEIRNDLIQCIDY